MEDKGVNPFPKGINPKVKIVVGLECEHIYYDVAGGSEWKALNSLEISDTNVLHFLNQKTWPIFNWSYETNLPV